MMLRKKHAQIALEYLIILAVILAVLSPLIYSQVNKYATKQRLSNTNKLANDIAKSADSLYSLGPGNQKYLYIDVPKGISDVKIYGREIVFTVSTPDGDQDIILLTKGYVTGVIPTSFGIHRITMKVLGTGEVLIGEPYCHIQKAINCTNNNNMNPILYLTSNYNGHASLYYNATDPGTGNTFVVADYSICCKNTVSMEEVGGHTYSTIMLRLNNDYNSHVADKDFAFEGYDIEARLYTTGQSNISCEIADESIDYCAELGQDFYCLATLENAYYNKTGWNENFLVNSHISDCDGDWDDFPIKLCCVIPPD